MPRGEMLARMSSRELTEWMAYYDLERLGVSPEDRADLRAGIVASASLAPWSKHKAPSPVEFMPFREEPEADPVATWQAIKAAFAATGKLERRAKPDG